MNETKQERREDWARGSWLGSRENLPEELNEVA